MIVTPESLIQKEYEKNIEKYKKLDRIVYDKITDMIMENEFFIMDVSHRVKTPKSLEKKLNKKFGKYQTIYDITDLCGIRIICYFADSVDKIAECIRKTFVLDEKNSIDKKAHLQATQFGYLSLHCICTLRPDSGYDEELCKISFEIQIRTVLQHAWAEIEHDLGYKSDFGIPRIIRRNFSRVAGLLELADEQFVSLRNSSAAYSENIRNRIADGNADDLQLDQLSLNEYAHNNKSFNETMDRLSELWKVDILPAPVDKYLPQLEWLGIRTIGELAKRFSTHEDLIGYLIQRKLEDMDLDIISTSTFFRYLCRADLMLGNYTEDQIFEFYKLSYNDVRSAHYTEKTLRHKKGYLKAAGMD